MHAVQLLYTIHSELAISTDMHVTVSTRIQSDLTQSPVFTAVFTGALVLHASGLTDPAV